MGAIAKSQDDLAVAAYQSQPTKTLFHSISP